MTDIWNIISDIVLPHIGRIIVNIIAFSFLGLLVSILLLVIMFRKKVMTRSHAAYHIIVRIVYIPLVVLVCIYSFGNLGFIRGVYQVVSTENQHMVNGIYEVSVNQFFATEKQKDLFVRELKETLLQTEASGLSFADSFEKQLSGNSSKSSKPGFTSRIMRTYRKEIYKTVLNGMFYAADHQFDHTTDYKSLNKAIDLLYSTDRARIEDAVKSALGEKLQHIVDSHYRSALISDLLLWFLLMSIPFIEFIIYRLLNKKQQAMQESGGKNLEIPGED